MAKLVTIKLVVFDANAMLMPGFPLIRGPKNGRMAAEAYTDKNGSFEFLASPNRDIEIKLLSPDNRFNEVFYCRSGSTKQSFKVTLQYPKSAYLSQTKIVWRSKYSARNIPHTRFKSVYQNRSSLLSAENGEKDIYSLVGEPVELSYIFPDGKRFSQTILYQARRINPPPLIITVDNSISDATTAPNQPTVPKQILAEVTDCSQKFHKISKIVLQYEGGYVNDPQDQGGATNKGIAWRTWLAYAEQDLGVAPTLSNLKAITDAQAEIIYRKRYWEPKGFCQIRDDRVGLMVYDWSITSGGAGKEIQKLLVNQYHQKINIDGVIGPQTIAALNAVSDQNVLLNVIANRRRQYYTALAIDQNGHKKSNYKFLKGWLNRVQQCLEATL